MIQANTKCIIKSAPAVLAHLVGLNVDATSKEGARGTGSQGFSMQGGGLIFGNADTGIVVEAKD